MHANQACFQIPRDIPFQFQSMNFGKIFLSSGVAFFMAILVAILIETFGGAVGSVIGTLPSTVIPAAYIFITERTKTVDERVESVMSCLYGMVPTDLLFLPSWRIIPPKLPKKWSNGVKVLVTSVLSLLLWFLGAVAMILLKSLFTQIGLSIWVFGLVTLVFTAVCGGAICWTLPPTPAGKNKIPVHIHLIRGLAAAAAIFISGVLSQTNMGVIAGAMVTFPSIFITTLVSVSLSQGPEVATGAVGPMTLGGQSYYLKSNFTVDTVGTAFGAPFSLPSRTSIQSGALSSLSSRPDSSGASPCSTSCAGVVM